ncbi:MAG: hypothetical protein ACR2OW_03985 [Methyloligellaceae bacterium]
MISEKELYPVLNSQRWIPSPEGWVIDIDGITLEAREERRRWRARAIREGIQGRWTPFVETRWRAGLMAYYARNEEQTEFEFEK